MTLSIPSLDQALDDAGLAALDLRVLLKVARELDLQEWRPLKEVVLRRSLRLGRTRLYQALRTLVDAGYLERRGGGPGQVSEYRLPYTVRARERTDAA